MEDMFLTGLMRGDYNRGGPAMPNIDDTRQFQAIAPCILVETRSYAACTITAEFNFQTRQMTQIARYNGHISNQIVQNFDDLSRPLAIAEMEEKLRTLGGNPDLYKAPERKKQPLLPGKG